MADGVKLEATVWFYEDGFYSVVFTLNGRELDCDDCDHWDNNYAMCPVNFPGLVTNCRLMRVGGVRLWTRQVTAWLKQQCAAHGVEWPGKPGGKE